VLPFHRHWRSPVQRTVLPQWPPVRCKPCVPSRGRFLVRSSACSCATPNAAVLLQWPPVRCKQCFLAEGRSLVWSSASPQAGFHYKPCSHVRAPVPPPLALSYTKQCSLTGRPLGVNRAPLPNAALLYGAVLPHGPYFSINHAPMYVLPCHGHWRSVLQSCAPAWPPFGVNRAPLPKAALLFGAGVPHGPCFSISRASLHVLPCHHHHWRSLVQSSAPPMAARSVETVLPCERPLSCTEYCSPTCCIPV
jgi:hypothetical protein